jgi:hypothetical protein
MSEKPTPIYRRPQVPPAPYLTKHDLCSDCEVAAERAGDDELKVCPRCYALLWHRDSPEDRRRRQAAAVEVQKRAAAIQKRREEAAAKREAEQQQPEPPTGD